MTLILRAFVLTLLLPAITHGADNCLSFSGLGDYLEASSRIIPTTLDFTVELYIYKDKNKNKYEELISQGSQPYPFYIGFSPNGTLRFGDSWVSSDISLPDGQWSHIAVTHSSTNKGKVYINGALRGVNNDYFLYDGISNTRLSSQYGISPSEPFSGCIDELKIWNNVRSESEISEDIKKNIIGPNKSDLIAHYSFDVDSDDGYVYDVDMSQDKRLKIYGNPALIPFDAPNSAPAYYTECGLSVPSSPNDNNGHCNGAYFSSTIQDIIDPLYRDGFSYYALLWPLFDRPLNVQAGLGFAWIYPDTTFLSQEQQAKLCDLSSSEFGGVGYSTAYESRLWQSIEGSLGYWVDSSFRAAIPKYKINSTPNCMEKFFIETSPNWSRSQEDSGLVQLSNRIIVPPDGFTFTEESSGGLLGISWMSTDTPIHKAYDAGNKESSTWMLFFNSTNFKGPVVYYTPEYWSSFSSNSSSTFGLSFGSNSGYLNSFSTEFAIPYFETKDQEGRIYSKIPLLQFPSDTTGRTTLVSDMKSYSKRAIKNNFSEILNNNPNASTAFNKAFSNTLRVHTWPQSFQQGRDPVELEKTFSVSVFDDGDEFGLIWPQKSSITNIPEYYIKQDGKRIPTTQSRVPKALSQSSFAAQSGYKTITRPDWWSEASASTFPVTTQLSDGTTIRYAWYKFVDQPAIERLNLSPDEETILQKFAEAIHKAWLTSSQYIPPPKKGKLVSFDSGVLITPPPGLEYGYVPIVLSQSGDTAYVTDHNPIINKDSIFWKNINAPYKTLTVYNEGNGYITSIPDSISCGTACTTSFSETTNVVLSASPDAGFSFSGWSGACTGTASCSLTMNEDKQVTAIFSEIPINPYDLSKPFVKPYIPKNLAVVKQPFVIGWQLNMIRKNMPVRVMFAKDGSAYRVIKSAKARSAGAFDVGEFIWKPTKAQKTANGKLQICAVPSKGIAEVCSPATSITVQ